MRKPGSYLLAVVLLACSGTLTAANLSTSDKTSGEYTLDANGSFWIDNPFGDIEIIGADVPGLSVSARKTLMAEDKESMAEAREQTQIVIGGNRRSRGIRTILPAVRTRRWSSIVSYTIRVPRSTTININSNWSERIRVANVSGSVRVKNVNGPVILDSIGGATTVESVNGKIVFDSAARPNGAVQLQTVTGDIEVRVPPDSVFEWTGESVQSSFWTTFPGIRGRIEGSNFRGTINGPGGPTISTASMLGNVFLLRKGTSVAEATSVRQQGALVRIGTSEPVLHPKRVIQMPLVASDFAYTTNLGDFSIGQVRGSARIETGAGSVQLGTVFGTCNVTSLGGPLDLGDIIGLLTARTEAGDVQVRAAREGGFISTGGGTVRVQYTGGPTTIQSDGGDIVVRQAGAPIKAETRSGDITITVDANLRTDRVDATTAKGNIILNVSARFGADIDATVLTRNPQANVIRSDVSGLTFRRDQVGGRTRVRATGKINGGGDRVELHADEGAIQISVQNVPPVASPR